MEPKNLEKFNLGKNKLLQNKKSSAKKDILILDTETTEVKYQYNRLVDMVTAANPDMSPQQAYDKIQEVEKKHNNKFFRRVPDKETPIQRLVYEKRRLSQLEELNILTETEKQTLEKIRKDFREIVAEIVKTTGDDPDKTQKDIDTILINNIAKNLSEAKDIMVNGPVIKGFEETEDAKIPNPAVKEFLKDAFSPQILRRAKVGSVEKDDKYLIINLRNKEYREKSNKLISMGAVRFDSTNKLIAENKESYYQAEMLLEGVENPAELKHIYKLRATAGHSAGFHTIQLRSFGVEKPTDSDYLEDIALPTDEDKMRVYILGILAHEIMHRYEAQLTYSGWNWHKYKKIVEEETGAGRAKYVTDYALRHKELYESNDNEIFREDLAETVRIYVTNPRYLRENYPKRFAFIKKKFPFIKQGSAVEAVKKLINGEKS